VPRAQTVTAVDFRPVGRLIRVTEGARNEKLSMIESAAAKYTMPFRSSAVGQRASRLGFRGVKLSIRAAPFDVVIEGKRRVDRGEERNAA
jgi:hypothetical protein